jgi:hypothetical protein
MLETETGEIITRRLEHEGGEARGFYAGLGKPALIGIEATGYTQWFERRVSPFRNSAAFPSVALINM